MNRYSIRFKTIIAFIFLVALSITSCNSTSTPEYLKLVDGEIDACLLLTPGELETVTGFRTVANNQPVNPSGTSCTYSKTDGNPALILFVTTDETWKRNGGSGTAEDLYRISKAEELKHPEMYAVKDVEGLGSQAYFSHRDGFALAIRVLNNGIFYEFTDYETSGVNRDKLIQIAKIALQRAP